MIAVVTLRRVLAALDAGNKYVADAEIGCLLLEPLAPWGSGASSSPVAAAIRALIRADRLADAAMATRNAIAVELRIDPEPSAPIEWVPVADVAQLLGVGMTVLAEVLPAINPRQALLPNGTPQVQVDAAQVWRLADALNVPLPPRFPRPAGQTPPATLGQGASAANDPRHAAVVRTALQGAFRAPRPRPVGMFAPPEV